MLKNQTLYRMFDRDGRLLYVGISQRASRRFDEHGREKPWWNDVDRITVEHFPTRDAVEIAERLAIRSEAPLHNKQRYGGSDVARPTPTKDDGYHWTSKRGHTRTGPGRLCWEVYCDPISDDYLPEEIDAYELFRRWVDYVYKAPDWNVPIYWFVSGPGIFESVTSDYPGHGYDSYYLPPVDTTTGRRVALSTLPVEDKLWHPGRGDKGGFIQEATGWKPSPLQPTVPLIILVEMATARAGIKC